jgi:putative transposase
MDPSNIIERERTPLPLMACAVHLFCVSRSLRLASRCLEPIIRRNHVAIWTWVQRFGRLSDRCAVDRRDVKSIFADETLIHTKGGEYWLWMTDEPRRQVPDDASVCEEDHGGLLPLPHSS